MPERYVVCHDEFLGAGDRAALMAVAHDLSGHNPVLFDMARLNGKDPAKCRQAMQETAQAIRAETGDADIVFLSTGISSLHPLANELKNSLKAKWVDIRLDLDQDQSFRNYPKMPGPRQPVEHMIGLRNMSVGTINSFLTGIFRSASEAARSVISTVPVTPDHYRMDRQAAAFKSAHPGLSENAVVVLLGSYMNHKTRRDLDGIMESAATEGRPVILVTSPRTEKQQAKIVDTLEQKYANTHGVHLHRFNADQPEKNIYPGVLAFAGDVVVTSDSLTMISESVALGRRTHVLSTMADRPGYLNAIEKMNLIRRVDGPLDTAWTPSARPDPFQEIRTSLGLNRVKDTRNTAIAPLENAV
ncbi:MAG: mitochondrial fission [Micavibrio sp.]|nr:mitochondrial fission [Micavibrio sp.]